MTLEEAQNKIIEQNTLIDTLNIEKTSLTTSLETLKTEKQTLSDEVTKLREHNMKLFLKLSVDDNKNEGNKNENNKNDVEIGQAPSIEDILNDF